MKKNMNMHESNEIIPPQEWFLPKEYTSVAMVRATNVAVLEEMLELLPNHPFRRIDKNTVMLPVGSPKGSEAEDDFLSSKTIDYVIRMLSSEQKTYTVKVPRGIKEYREIAALFPEREIIEENEPFTKYDNVPGYSHSAHGSYPYGWEKFVLQPEDTEIFDIFRKYYTSEGRTLPQGFMWQDNKETSPISATTFFVDDVKHSLYEGTADGVPTHDLYLSSGTLKAKWVKPLLESGSVDVNTTRTDEKKSIFIYTDFVADEEANTLSSKLNEAKIAYRRIGRTGILLLEDIASDEIEFFEQRVLPQAYDTELQSQTQNFGKSAKRHYHALGKIDSFVQRQAKTLERLIERFASLESIGVQLDGGFKNNKKQQLLDWKAVMSDDRQK